MGLRKRWTRKGKISLNIYDLLEVPIYVPERTFDEDSVPSLRWSWCVRKKKVWIAARLALWYLWPDLDIEATLCSWYLRLESKNGLNPACYYNIKIHCWFISTITIFVCKITLSTIHNISHICCPSEVLEADSVGQVLKTQRPDVENIWLLSGVTKKIAKHFLCINVGRNSGNCSHRKADSIVLFLQCFYLYKLQLHQSKQSTLIWNEQLVWSTNKRDPLLVATGLQRSFVEVSHCLQKKWH